MTAAVGSLPDNPETMKKYKLSSVLKQLETEQRTGTLMSVNEDNILGRIYVVNGKPRAARCRNIQGQEALNQINDKLQVSVKFHQEVNLVNSQSVIDTNKDSVAAESAFSNDENVSVEEFNSAFDITELTDNKFAHGLLERELTPAIREVLATELVEHLGPLAQIIVSDLEDGISVREALNSLSQEIGDMDAAIKFIEELQLKA